MALPATLTLENTSASATAGGFIAPMFGHVFAQGDIPTGKYPRFELSDGTVCPHTMFSESRWADGSLKFAAFLLRVPVSVAGSGSVTVSVKGTGTSAHGASSRTIADCGNAGTDLNVSVVGLDNLSGTWVSSLNQGITDGDVEILGNGPVGMVAKVRQEFMQSGAAHGQLETMFYVALLQDAGGGLAGIRYLGRVYQPYYNQDTPAKNFRSFSSFTVKNGAAIVRDCWASRSGVTKAWRYPTTLGTISNSTERAKWAELVGANDMEQQTLVRLSGTTLPTGLAANTSYFIDVNKYASHVGFFTDPGLDPSVMALPSGTSSGDCTMVAYPYLAHFGSLYTAGPTARWDFIQAGGSMATDAPVRVRHDSVYWQSSGMVPAYAATSVDVQTGYGYEPNSMLPILRYVGTTGERGDIGVLPDWSVKHLISQRAADETTVRSTGLKHAHASIAVYEKTTRAIQPVNNKTYTGLPASSTTFRWSGDPIHTSGFTHPGSSGTGLSALSMDHMPSLSAYPYMVTGEPQFLDTMVEMANITVIGGYAPVSTLSATNAECERNASIGGTTYYGVVAFTTQLRSGAWAMRDLAFASALTPDSHKAKPYLVDLNANNYAAMRAYNDLLAPAFWKSSGLIAYPYAGIISPWQVSYMGQAIAQAVRMTGDSNALFMLNHLVKWWNNIYANNGVWHMSSYRQIIRTASSGGAIVDGFDKVGYGITDVTINGATGRITLPVQGSYTPQNGDVVMWDRASGNNDFGEGNAPIGLAACTPYYLINKSGDSFQVAATPGGTALPITDSYSTKAYIRVQAPPATSCFGDLLTTSGYLSNMRGMLKTAKAAGATVTPAMLSDMDTRLSGVSYSADPRYNFTDTVVASVPVDPAPPNPAPVASRLQFFGGAQAALPQGVMFMEQVLQLVARKGRCRSRGRI